MVVRIASPVVDALVLGLTEEADDERLVKGLDAMGRRSCDEYYHK